MFADVSGSIFYFMSFLPYRLAAHAMSASGGGTHHLAVVQLPLLRRWSRPRGSGEPPDAVAKHHDRDDRIPWTVTPRSIAASRLALQDTPHRALTDTLPVIGAASAARPEPASSVVPGRRWAAPAAGSGLRRADPPPRSRCPAVDPGIQLPAAALAPRVCGHLDAEAILRCRGTFSAASAARTISNVPASAPPSISGAGRSATVTRSRSSGASPP